MYYYLTHYQKKIENDNFVCIKILYLDEDKHQAVTLNCYKRYSKDLENNLDNLNVFANITEYIDFKVRNDGKVVANLEI